MYKIGSLVNFSQYSGNAPVANPLRVSSVEEINGLAFHRLENASLVGDIEGLNGGLWITESLQPWNTEIKKTAIPGA